MDIRKIPLSSVSPSPMNPRKTFNEEELRELAENIEKQGLLQPITVRPKGAGYEVVCGERRYRASMLLKEKEDLLNVGRAAAHRKRAADFQTIAAIVREMSDEDAFDAMITENLLRVDVDPIEEAFAFGQLIENGNTVEEVAARFGKSIRFVTERVKLNTLIPELMMAVKDDKMSIGAALIICKLDEEEQRKYHSTYVNHYQGLSKATAKSFVDNLFMNLDKSLWYQSDNKADEDFAGGCGRKCGECMLNTINHGCLFYEMKCEDSGRCTDREQFKEKTYAYVFQEIDRMADELVRKGEPLADGKMVVAIGDYSGMSESAKALRERVRADLDKRGIQVVNAENTFRGKCWYAADDERTIEKLKSGELYRVLNLFAYESPTLNEQFWYVKQKSTAPVEGVSAETPVDVATLLAKYQAEKNTLPSSLVTAVAKAISEHAQPTTEPLQPLEKQMFCLLMLQANSALRKHYGLSSVPNREKDYECVTQNPDFFDQCVRAWLQARLSIGNNAELRQAEPVLNMFGALWCNDESQKAIEKAHAKHDKAVEKITKQLAELGYDTEGKPLVVSEDQDTADILSAFTKAKRKHPDAIMLLEDGCHYTLLKEDAEIAAPILGITLAPWYKDPSVNQAGFLKRAIDEYLPKLIRAGKRVAIIKSEK